MAVEAIVSSSSSYNGPWTVSSKDQYLSLHQEMKEGGVLVSSPYDTVEHHLELSSVPETSQQLALALTSFRPVTNEYPSRPYVDSFNWKEVINQLPPDFSGTLLEAVN